MIRQATIEDLPVLAEHAQKFFTEGGLPGKFKSEVFIEGWSRLMASGFGNIWMMEKEGNFAGALGATIAPDINDGELVAHEMFWYVLPEYRGGIEPIRLLKTFEKQSIGVGAKRVILAHVKLNPEGLKNLYVSLGYSPIETNYIKVIE